MGAGAVLLTFLGVWLGHCLEYLRLGGGLGLRATVLGGTHLYMLPLGALLTLIAAHLGVRAWRLWRGLGRRLEVAHSLLVRALRGRTSTLVHEPPPCSTETISILLLWPPLALGQIGLYLLQENLEAVLTTGRASGLGAVAGVHWAAPLVHGGVALLLAAVVAVISRQIHDRASRLHHCERLVAALRRACRCVPTPRRASVSWSPTPLQRFGAQLWSRPPPA
ncbi:MAG TPA: hypothetical protein VGL20_20390 [Candidatus Dormibacteraeota bacterium]